MAKNSSNKKPYNMLGDVCVLAAVASAIHIAALWMKSDTVVDLDFSRPGGSDYIDSLKGWVLTPAGLAAPPSDQTQEAPVMMIGILKSSYEDLFLDIQTTQAGRGNVRALLLDDRYKPEQAGFVPEGDAEGAAWRLGLGRSKVGIDASQLVLEGRPVNLTQLWPDDRTTLIAIEPVNGATGPLIRSISLRRSLWRWSMLLVPFYWLTIVSVGVFLAGILAGVTQRRILTVVCFLLVAAACFVPIDVLAWGNNPVGLAACIGITAFLKGKQPAAAWLVVLLACLYVGVDLRLAELNLARFRPLDPDAVAYRTIAESMTWFYDSGYREPLFTLLQKISLLILGETDYAVRMVSFAASVALIPFAAYAGRRIHSYAAGIIVAALIATSPEWASQSVRGLRLEWFTLALLGLTAVVLADNVENRRRHLGMMIFSACAICLIRVTSLWFCLLAVGYGIYRQGWKTRDFVIAMTIVIGVQIPFFINCQRQFGDPLFACNQHIRFYRNQEFRDEPGYPTSEEIEADAYAGPPVTAAEYFFGMHSVGELTRRTVREFNSIFLGSKLRTLVCSENGFMHCWAIVALAIVAVSKYRLLLIWMVVLIGPITWLYSDSSEPEWRLIFHVSAFVYLCMAIAATEICRNAVTDPNVAARQES